MKIPLCILLFAEHTYVGAFSISRSAVSRDIHSSQTALFVKPQDFSAGPIRPAVPFRGLTLQPPESKEEVAVEPPGPTIAPDKMPAPANVPKPKATPPVRTFVDPAPHVLQESSANIKAIEQQSPPRPAPVPDPLTPSEPTPAPKVVESVVDPTPESKAAEPALGPNGAEPVATENTTDSVVQRATLEPSPSRILTPEPAPGPIPSEPPQKTSDSEQSLGLQIPEATPEQDSAVPPPAQVPESPVPSPVLKTPKDKLAPYPPLGAVVKKQTPFSGLPAFSKLAETPLLFLPFVAAIGGAITLRSRDALLKKVDADFEKQAAERKKEIDEQTNLALVSLAGIVALWSVVN